jgi:hypothetical protein
VLVRTVVVLGGPCSLVIFVVWPLPCTRGIETRGGLAGSSIVKRAESGSGEAILDTHLRVGKARGLSTELPNRELDLCEGIVARGSNED